MSQMKTLSEAKLDYLTELYGLLNEAMDPSTAKAIASAIQAAWRTDPSGRAMLPTRAIRTIARQFGMTPDTVADATHALGGNVPSRLGTPGGMNNWVDIFRSDPVKVITKTATKTASGAGKLGAKWAALKAGGGAAGGLGTAGTVALGAAGVAGAALAGRAAWNIWHSKMKPQVDSLEATLDELQTRTTKLQSKAFTQAMSSFNQRFDTAMKGAAFRDSDRVILGQAMALIDFYNNLAQSMFKVQKMQSARDISGTGGKVGVAGDALKIIDQPSLKEDYSLQELFGLGQKKEQEFQSDDTPVDDTTTDDAKTDSKKDTGKNWESKVNSVFNVLRAGALSGAPSKFTGGIKNMWATIGFKPAKTTLPPEFNEQAIDSLVAGLINTILTPGAGGAQGALKLAEMATGIDECLGKTLMEVSAQYDLLVLTEDLKAFMLRTPDLSAIADETAQAATPPPPAETQQIKQAVEKVAPPTSPEGAPGDDAGNAPGASPKATPPGGEPGSKNPKAAPVPQNVVGPKLLDDATLRKIAPAALQLFQSQTQDRRKFTTAAANGAIRIGKKPLKLTPEQSKQVIDFIKGSIGADRSGGGVIATGGQGVDMVGPNSSVAASLQDPTLMAKNKQRMQFIKDLTPSSREGRPIGIQSFLQAAKAGVVNPQTGGLSISQYGITLDPGQQQQARALGLLERLYKLMGAMTLLEKRIATLVNNKNVIKESTQLIETNNKIEFLEAYQKQVAKALQETVNKIRLLDIYVNVKHNHP